MVVLNIRVPDHSFDSLDYEGNFIEIGMADVAH